MKWIFATTLTTIVFSNAMAALPNYPWEKYTQQNGLYKVVAPYLFKPTNLKSCLETTDTEKADGFIQFARSSEQISFIIKQYYKNETMLLILDFDQKILEKNKKLTIINIADKSNQHILPRVYNTKKEPIKIPFKAIRSVISVCRQNPNLPWTVTQYVEPQKLTELT
jgi:hypothetical protein